MRISDWSSDVCSSDLDLRVGPLRKNRELTMRTSHPLSILAVTTALATTGWAVPAAAQDAGVDAVDDSATIIVTGTRRTDRTVADSAVPLDVLSAAPFANRGSPETNQLLKQLVPSFTFPSPTPHPAPDPP